MPSTAKKVRAVAEGAASGGASAAIIGGGLHYGMKALTSVAPRVAAGVGFVTSAPVLLTGAAIGGVYGGAKAIKRGDSAGKVALSVLGGAASLGTNVVADAFTSKADAQVKPREYDAGPAKAPKGGGEGKKDAARSRRVQGAVEGQVLRNQAELDALGAAPQDAGAITPASKPIPEPKKGMVQKVKEAVFGDSGPSEDALTREKSRLEGRAKELRRQIDEEIGGRSGQKGIGPNVRALQKELEKVENGDNGNPGLSQLTKQIAKREEESLAAWRQAGSAAAGAIVGLGIGGLTVRAANKAAEAAGAGVTKIARDAAAAVRASPRGVIANTVQGDRAHAAVAVAKEAMNRRVVGAAEAFGIPGLNLAHGGAAYVYAAKNPDDPASPFFRAEGAAAITAGVFGLKGGITAYNMRANVTEKARQQIAWAENRVGREVRTGPSGVAQAIGREKVAVASGRARVAQAGASRLEAVAKGSRDVARVNAGNRVEAARVGSKTQIVKAGTKLEVAKVRGAGQVERAQINSKASNSRAIDRRNVDIKYKDVWVDRRGRVLHRKDMSVRTRKGKIERVTRAPSRRALPNDKPITMQKNIMGTYEMAMKGR